MKSRTLLLVAPLLAALIGNAHAADAPTAMTVLAPFRASYEVRLNNLPFKATATQTLSQLAPGRWRLELRVESFIIDTVEYSEFRWNGENCRTIPERYGYTRSGIGRDSELFLSFDHAKHLVTRTGNKKTTTFPVPENTEDKLGHSLALGCRVARGARGGIAFDVAWDHDVRHLDYRVLNTERIVTPYAAFDALKIERQRTDSERLTTTWLAAAAGWQAVQMQHTEGDGRLFSLRLLEMSRHDAK